MVFAKGVNFASLPKIINFEALARRQFFNMNLSIEMFSWWASHNFAKHFFSISIDRNHHSFNLLIRHLNWLKYKRIFISFSCMRQVLFGLAHAHALKVHEAWKEKNV